MAVTILLTVACWGNIQVKTKKRYESDTDRILGLSVTMNGSSKIFINVYFPVACHEKYEEYIMCLGILSSILESYEENHVCILGDFNATPGSPRYGYSPGYGYSSRPLWNFYSRNRVTPVSIQDGV